jgi:hypothetical protein
MLSNGLVMTKQSVHSNWRMNNRALPIQVNNSRGVKPNKLWLNAHNGEVINEVAKYYSTVFVWNLTKCFRSRYIS